MPAFSRIVVVGVGLIGGSVGKAARERGAAQKVVGLVRSEASAERAWAADVVDLVTTDAAEACAGADLVVICTPVGSIVDSLKTVLPHLPAEAIVTDAGSTKSSIVREADKLLTDRPDGPFFVGAHPLAGGHQTGPEAAHRDLFEGKAVIVTPSGATIADAVARVTDFWEQLGATVSSMPPESHDRLVAETSHLPHLMASLLAATVSESAYPYVASGWRDTTRVASGDPGLWVDIFRDNSDQVLAAASHFRSQLDHFIEGMANENWPQVRAILETGKQRRDDAESLPANDTKACE